MAVGAILYPLMHRFAPDLRLSFWTALAAILLHILLDSLVGDIMWLWPVSRDLYALFTVPARYSHWLISFVLHWSFAVELMICAVAVWLCVRRPAKQRPSA